jgi:chromosome segregation ATPase
MLANQNLMIETMKANHQHTESVLSLLTMVCSKLNLTDVGAECQQLKDVLTDTESMYSTLKDASTADLSQVLDDVKKYAGDVVSSQANDLKDSLKKQADASMADVSDRFRKLESRVLSELATQDPAADATGSGVRAKTGDTQLLKKVTSRMTDFEAQVTSQMQVMQQDMEKKLSFLGSQPRAADGQAPVVGMDSLSHDIDALKYDVSELKDMLGTAKSDTAHVKRIVLACERDMEDFTAAMDAVNVDLDEMRARVDSTHSIITSRQRVEATVTAEISTMRLDMGDMQEALKAHDAWMEDVSQSLQEAHERCQQLSSDIAELRDQTQAKLDGKVDIVAWNDMNDDIDASIKTVRDMVSTLRLEVDSRRRKVDESLTQIRSSIKSLDEKVDHEADDIRRFMDDNHKILHKRVDERHEHCNALENTTKEHAQIQRDLDFKIDTTHNNLDSKTNKIEADLRKQDEDMHKEVNDRADGIERHHANVAKETSKRLNALDLRISGLQGASGEQKRDINKLRDEVNNLTVKSAAHDVDIGKNSDDIKKMERQRAEDNQRHKQDMDAVYEELDQKVYEKNFLGLEDNVCKLTRGSVKLCQVVGVFPGARMDDGTEEELDIDVELLNWEDCAQNMVARVDKTWRQLSSQKYKSILDLVSKKADHSVLRLLQISQQHIESQLDRVRHERELWKEVVDKRSQQPLQLALTLKDQHTGMPLGGAMGAPMTPMGQMQQFAGQPGSSEGARMSMGPPGTVPMQEPNLKASPLAKRIAKPAGPPPKA